MRPNGCCGPDWRPPPGSAWTGLQATPFGRYTGARHKAANGVTTQIGNSHFTWFGTTGSKSRLNFLSLLRAGHDDYVVNSAALDYMRRQNLAGRLRPWRVRRTSISPARPPGRPISTNSGSIAR